ncbi:DUF4258 domain-containing protein [Candidatus Bipolaricaulota bacterium]|nr:DUF4258 domain-containing protein [Candidatus Bipolaricaulota bacterium]
MDLSALKKAIDKEQYLWRKHALTRLAERGINQEEAIEVIKEGEVVENYPDDTPYPSCLTFKKVDGRPIHVVVALDSKENFAYIITVYEPSSEEFESDFKTRRN